LHQHPSVTALFVSGYPKPFLGSCSPHISDASGVSSLGMEIVPYRNYGQLYICLAREGWIFTADEESYLVIPATKFRASPKSISANATHCWPALLSCSWAQRL